MRKPAVAGLFYPSDPEVLKSFILGSVSDERLPAKGVLVPHAGYEYSGRVAVRTLSSVEPKFETVVIIGVDHANSGRTSTDLEDWETPLGIIKIDTEFARELKLRKGTPGMEHSIEVQVPIVQVLFPDVRFVPVCMPHGDFEKAKEIGEKIFRVAEKLGRNILVVASSDLTHHGPGYGYVKYSGSPDEILRGIRKEDDELLQRVLAFDVDGIIQFGRHGTACGYGCIAAMVHAVRSLAAAHSKVIEYTTSYEVSRDISHVVSYAGVVFW
ncbi:MAG: AmmeMemoRadiSam system protein B [Candidatus Micrarchaeota archaeon]|nr:AmmeMemoRadiSam system protein B [Candidatus Micrarchaeota archaeon]